MHCRRSLIDVCRREVRGWNPRVVACKTAGQSQISFSTNLNDNASRYYKEGNHIVIPKEEWTNNHDKISVLKTEEASLKKQKSARESNLYGDHPRVSVLMELTDRVGVLHDVLKYFWKYDLNVTRIESRPVASSSRWGGDGKPKFDFYMDFDGSLDVAVQKLLKDLEPITSKLLVLDEKDVHWFPRHVSELDMIAHRTLDAGVDLESEHPGFNDQTYRSRRAELAQNALQHRWDKPISYIAYRD